MTGCEFCPNCGNDNWVTRASWQNKEGNRRRRKKCQVCGATWGTVEILYEDAVALEHIWEYAKDLKKVLEGMELDLTDV